MFLSRACRWLIKKSFRHSTINTLSEVIKLIIKRIWFVYELVLLMVVINCRMKPAAFTKL